MFRHGLALLRCAFDRTNNAQIGAAAADMGTHMLDNLVARGMRLLPEQVDRTHDLARLAVATLRHTLGEPSLLYRMRRIVRQTFNRRDSSAGDFGQLRLARKSALVVNVHHAGAAQSGATAEFRAHQLDLLANDPKQGRLRRGVGTHALSVDAKRDWHWHFLCPVRFQFANMHYTWDQGDRIAMRWSLRLRLQDISGSGMGQPPSIAATIDAVRAVAAFVRY